MRSRQMKLWVNRAHDTETIWPTLSQSVRAQVARGYAKAVAKAARVRTRSEAASDGGRDEDSSQ